jgi:hypothetical protein
MDISRIRELEYRISHRHKDGAWGEMVESPTVHHSAVDHDPERQWLEEGTLYKCTSCDEWAIIRKADESGRPIRVDDDER